MLRTIPEIMTEEQCRFIGKMVADGKYPDAGSVIQAGFDLLKVAENDYEYCERRLKREIQKGLDSLDNGRGILLKGDDELHQFFDEKMAKVTERHEASKKRKPLVLQEKNRIFSETQRQFIDERLDDGPYYKIPEVVQAAFELLGEKEEGALCQ
jgi:Arc/MetJ-type ribon-helix-helix transcriptional regulator